MEYALWGITRIVSSELFFVLILVLMEYALWEEVDCEDNPDIAEVLILVLMEYALWVEQTLLC